MLFMKNKRKGIIITVSFILVIILVLWINGIIPRQIAKISSIVYLKKNFPKIQLEYVNIEWASSFGDYIITFKDQNSELHSFCIGPKYFPVNLGQGMFGFEEEYREKYDKQKEDINIDGDTEISTFIRTYNILNMADSNDEKYIYLTIKQFQEEEVKTVKIEKSLASNIEIGNDYEFTFKYTNNMVHDNIESIFENTKLISVEKTDKQGIEQIQDLINENKE